MEPVTLQDLKKARLRVAHLVVEDESFGPIFQALDDAIRRQGEDVQEQARALLEKQAA